MKNKAVLCLVAALGAGLAASLAAAERKVNTEIVVSSMFTANMVLQRGVRIPVWGTAQAGESVSVSFGGQRKTAAAGPDGSWETYLDPLPASYEPRDMTVDYLYAAGLAKAADEDHAVVMDNVLVGDVWFCSGQSNMEMGMTAIENSPVELKDTKYTQIRLYPLFRATSPFPQKQVVNVWREADRYNLVSGGWNGFSAVAYLFGRKLHKELGVPIGPIQAAYGGSSIDPWIPPEEMKGNSVLAADYALIVEADKRFQDALRADPKAKHPWEGIMDYSQIKPAMLYNAMVCPVAPYALKGAIWYQGETNVGEGMAYTEKMKALISGWRRVFRQPDMPFYFVELPPWEYGSPGSLPSMWLAQEACLSIPHTGMAVTLDVGDPANIHPTNKKPVAERLALIALADAYGRKDVISSGPVFKSMEIRGAEAIIHFDSVSGGLVAKDGGPLSFFEVAGSDMAFVPAKAEIRGGTVVVKNDTVKKPVAVRYAWSNTSSASLFNAAGLPARPFIAGPASGSPKAP
jgi:sialate O-acetylesterase